MASYTLADPAHYHLLGTLEKVQGLDGALVLRSTHALDSFPAPANLWCYQHHSYVPYAVTTWKVTGQHATLTLHGITDRTSAEAMRQTQVFLPKDAALLRVLAQTGTHLQGYKVIEEGKGILGEVVEVVQRKLQPLLVVDREGEELLIPFHPTFIKHEDHDQGTLYVALPSSLYHLEN